MNNTFFSILKYILLLSLGLFLLWLTFRHEDPVAIFEKIRHADLSWILLSCIFAILAFLSRAYRWNMLIEPLGYTPKLSTTTYALMVGYFANLLIPRLGEITRCGSLSKAEKVPFDVLIGTVIIERVIDLVMLAFSILLVAFFEYEIMGGFLMDNLVHPMVGKLHSIKNAWAVLLIIIACLITLIFLIRKNMDRFRTRPWFVKAEKLITGVINGVRTVAKMKRNGLFIAHTFFIWAMYFFMTYFCFFALDSTSHLGLKAGMFVLVIGGLGMSAPVQGGIGAYHWIVSQGLLLFNIDLTDGIVFATLVHTSQTILVIILGLLSLFMLFLTGKKPVGHEKK